MSIGIDQIRCSCGATSAPTARYCAWCGVPLGTGAGRRIEERRRVTALFADLSNFSRLVATLDSEDLVALIDPVIAALTGIIDRHGGYVEKFAGDALLALFGAPTAHEDDPLRAVQAAADLHAYLASRSAEDRPIALRLHVGIGSGPVVARTIGNGARTDYAVLGDAVVLAQRLQSLAPAGETYVDAATVALADHQFRFDALGPQLVKGRDEPVPVHRLAGRRSQMVARAGRVFAGRDEELNTLVSDLGDAAGGRRRVRWVLGPAGSGKSQLLAQLRRRAGPVVSLELVASSVGRSPYATLRPLVDASVAARLPGSSMKERLDRLDDDPSAPASAALTTLLLDEAAGTDPSVADMVPHALRRELRTAAIAWWRDLARRGPLLVTLDNTQWLDAASAEVVAGIVAGGDAESSLLCLSGRDPGPLKLDALPRLELSPLPREAVRDLVAAEARTDPQRQAG